MHTISLDASVAMTGISRSTLWRRVTDGSLAMGEKDARGRATLALDEVLALAELPLNAEDVAMLRRADAGEPEAQADVGALCYVGGAHKAALYWLTEAAAQGSAEAMQWLATAYAAGGGAASYRKMPILPSCGCQRRPRWGTRSRASRWRCCWRSGGEGVRARPTPACARPRSPRP